ncbi:outer surface protein [Bacillus salipaludis]|uniref:Outer surface protein n=1 Tax=Bacillus salipaludis TaxID=2547811 RepID=A0ABW8RDF1_9BACI
MGRRIIKIVILATLVVGACVYISLGKESKIQGLPVPLFAKYIVDDNPKDFKYSRTGTFKVTLWINGWKETYYEGELTKFQKNKREVLVFQPTGDNAIYLYEEYHGDGSLGL